LIWQLRTTMAEHRVLKRWSKITLLLAHRHARARKRVLPEPCTVDSCSDQAFYR